MKRDPAEQEGGKSPEFKPHDRLGLACAVGIVLLVVWSLKAAMSGYLRSCSVPAHLSCIANLKLIDGAVQQWALENHKKGSDTVSMLDIMDYLKGSVPPGCLCGGTFRMTYRVSTVSERPVCTQSALGHTL
jgi:hypothetical protein